MYLADYHVHSRISTDSKTSMTDMALAAWEKGLDEVCFTDHLEPTVWRQLELLPDYDWQALTAEFAQAQADAGDRIKLRLGIEMGDVPYSPDNMEKLLQGMPELDFVIGSVHAYSKRFGYKDASAWEPRDEAEARACIVDYLELVRQTALWGRFSVLGHLTLPLRYMRERFGYTDMGYDGFEAEVAEIFRLLIQDGRGIELNTNRGNSPLPDPKWLKLYRELGGEIITVGSDAHDVRMVGCKLRENLELLRQCGFKRYCTFEKMQPIWHELD